MDLKIQSLNSFSTGANYIAVMKEYLAQKQNLFTNVEPRDKVSH